MSYKPSKKQQLFHSVHLMGVDECLFGGSVGPGKTESLIRDPHELIQEEHERWLRDPTYQSKAVIGHFRKNFPSLRQTITRIGAFLREITGRKPKYNSTDHVFTMDSGLIYQIGHLATPTAFENYVGQEYTRLYFDEVNQIEEFQVNEVKKRLRAADPHLRKYLAVRMACNPAPGWVRDRFVAPAPKGNVVLTEKMKGQGGEIIEHKRCYIPATLYDHPDKEFVRTYEKQIRASSPPHVADALINGNWYVVAGSFFAELWDPQVHVCDPFPIPRTWPRFRCADWGYKTPGCIYWVAISPNNCFYVYREMTFIDSVAKEVAEAAIKVEVADRIWDHNAKMSMIGGVLDTSAWRTDGAYRGPAVADVFRQQGLPFTKASKGRAQIAQLMASRLKHRNADGSPAICFFSTCKKAIETIPALPSDPDDPEVPKKCSDDHWYDAIGYGLAARYSYKTLAPPMPFEYNDDTLDNSTSYVTHG